MKFVPKPLVETADISRGQSSWPDRLKYFVSAAVVMAALYLLIVVSSWALARWIPDRTEAKWLASYPDISSGTETPGFERAQRLFDRMIEQPGLRKLSYRLFALDMDLPNAVAVPGGGIGVHLHAECEETAKRNLALKAENDRLREELQDREK